MDCAVSEKAEMTEVPFIRSAGSSQPAPCQQPRRRRTDGESLLARCNAWKRGRVHVQKRMIFRRRVRVLCAVCKMRAKSHNGAIRSAHLNNYPFQRRR
jgi:hypothetical protein